MRGLALALAVLGTGCAGPGAGDHGWTDAELVAATLQPSEVPGDLRLASLEEVRAVLHLNLTSNPGLVRDDEERWGDREAISVYMMDALPWSPEHPNFLFSQAVVHDSASGASTWARVHDRCAEGAPYNVGLVDALAVWVQPMADVNDRIEPESLLRPLMARLGGAMACEEPRAPG